MFKLPVLIASLMMCTTMAAAGPLENEVNKRIICDSVAEMSQFAYSLQKQGKTEKQVLSLVEKAFDNNGVEYEGDEGWFRLLSMVAVSKGLSAPSQSYSKLLGKAYCLDNIDGYIQEYSPASNAKKPLADKGELF